MPLHAHLGEVIGYFTIFPGVKDQIHADSEGSLREFYMVLYMFD